MFKSSTCSHVLKSIVCLSDAGRFVKCKVPDSLLKDNVLFVEGEIEPLSPKTLVEVKDNAIQMWVVNMSNKNTKQN